ncbi:methyltransferase domain-containing protein [Actinomadura sp. LD22]|uniref:Methyltransferase domain-containing protein n=1 Tax=Actinomadura physcomitrii TaxID=2650748 RepID=A0A6I4MRQ2_9ACTN|nr:class I SAM-dependent methyltransferase [Actinomadura physcomitrii]MWA04976.1 methyltransferase domain-containing protein [Actinomadura physcomitrii]
MPEHRSAVPVAAAGAADRRAEARRTAFLFQDGVVLAAAVAAFDALDLLDGKPYDTGGLPGTGYLGAAWHCLAAAGWIEPDPAAWTERGLAALRHRARLVAGGKFLARFDDNAPDCWAAPWDAATRAAFGGLLRDHERWRAGADPADPLTAYLDATLAVPAILSLRGTGRLDEPTGDFARLFVLLGWLDPGGGWTEPGRACLAFSGHCGLVGSYLPMLSRLEALFRGELVVAPGDGEWHCQRRINVAASSAAHRRYFADTDAIIQEIFRRTPRPSFVADMGCGDGTWLAHLHGLLGDGVRYVGIDASPVALDRAREVLRAAGVPDPLLLIGDVTDPDALRALLAEHGLAIDDGLHIRSFLDHDRSYLGAEPRDDVAGWSSGVYLAPDGSPLSAREVESDLVAHLGRWRRHVGRFGMVVIEAHSVAPRVARHQAGATHSAALDTYHALSHQYLIEYSAFLRCCGLAGLQPVGHLERRYPRNRPFVAVSANHLVTERPLPAGPPGERHDTWRPGPEDDLADGAGLHRLLFTDGDLTRPRTWCAGATGIVVHQVLEAVEARIERVRPGDAVRVLDYGAGTGFASIELLKACLERNVVRRLAERGATFELHLVDIPGGWFAQGYELLRHVPWTRFHALRGPGGGGFRPLREVMAGRRVDAVLANMVFHLLPDKAMRRAAASIAGVLRPGGLLAFSAPDLAGRHADSVLFHDVNRLVRRYWLAALDTADPGGLAPVLREAAASVRPALRAPAQRRADRRILPEPVRCAAVTAALAPYFDGAVERRTYEFLVEECLLGALVPANQQEYFAELADRPLREAVIRHLMLDRVLPEVMSGPAGTAHGVNVEWKLGRFTAR